jgi:hypothetical protein
MRVNGLSDAEKMKNFFWCLIEFVCKGHEFFRKSTLFYYKIVSALFLLNKNFCWAKSSSRKKERTKGQKIKNSHDSKKMYHAELAKVELISILKNVTLFVFTVGDN